MRPHNLDDLTRRKRQKWQKIKIPSISFSLHAPCSCSSGNISRDGGPWCLLEMGKLHFLRTVGVVD